MHTLRLFVISIDAVRDIFGADPALAERLRASAAARFAPAPAERPTSLLSRLGPLRRRAPATEVDASQPLAGDVEALLAGGYVPPDRQRQGWQVLLHWLGELSAADETLLVDDLDAREFDLACAGLASDHSLRHLAGRQLGLPLRPPPGALVGYARHGQAVEALHALEDLEATAGAEFAEAIARTGPVRAMLEVVAGDPALDLVIVETTGLTQGR